MKDILNNLKKSDWDNTDAYYEGRKDGLIEADYILIQTDNKEEAYIKLNELRKIYIDEREAEKLSDFINEDNRQFLNGKIDGVDIIRDTLYDSIKGEKNE